MKKNWLWGILCILGAAFIFGNLFGLIHFAISIWKIVGALICLSIAIDGIKERSFYTPLFGLAILFYIFRKELGFPSISLWLLLLGTWLLAWGLSSIFSPKNKHVEIEFNTEDIEYSNDSAINITSRIGEKIQYIQATDLQYVTIDSKFSELKIYFDQANIQNQATLEVNGSFSSITLFVPKEWNIQNNVKSIFGGINEKGQPQSNGYPVLNMQGNLNFGEIEIHYI